jgi:putative inorganic carbon (HCO3(-)) transporter
MNSDATQVRRVGGSAPSGMGWGVGGAGSLQGAPQLAPLGAYGRLRSWGTTSLLVTILSPFLALSTRYVPKVLLAIVILDIPLEFGTNLFYRDNDAALGALGGLSISATTVALSGLYLSWLIRMLMSKRTEARPSLHISGPLLLYLVISSISVLVATDITLALFEVFILLEASLVYFYVANNVHTREDVTFVVFLLLVACLLEDAIMIGMFFTVTPATTWDLPIHIHAEWTNPGHLLRLGGTVGSPNVAAGYLSISMASAASVFFTDLQRTYRWLATAVLALGVVALILTYSRGGWIALALAVTLMSLAVWRQRGLSWRKPAAVVALLTVVCLPFYNIVSGRLFGDDRGSAQSRIPLMHLAFRIVKDNPVLGVGANNFTVVMDRYLTSDFREEFLFAVHNKYLLVLAETGIGGLLAFLAFLLAALRRGWRIWNLSDPLLSPVALGFVAGLAGHMVHMTVDVFRGRPVQQLIWLVAGLLAAMQRLSTAPARPERSTAVSAS